MALIPERLYTARLTRPSQDVQGGCECELDRPPTIQNKTDQTEQGVDQENQSYYASDLSIRLPRHSNCEMINLSKCQKTKKGVDQEDFTTHLT